MTGLHGQSQWPIVVPQIWELRLENLPELPLPVLCSVEKSHSLQATKNTAPPTPTQGALGDKSICLVSSKLPGLQPFMLASFLSTLPLK